MSTTPFNTVFGQSFNPNITSPYIANVTPKMPQPMAGGLTESNLYPLDSSMGTPQLNNPPASGYSHGGEVRNKKASKKAHSPYPALAEMIRQQGKGEDTILAHINPLEAMILKNLGGSGTINPKTGLPQFGLFNNPKKWLKSVAGPAVGAVVGNAILPGIGGVIGGGLGGVGGSAIRGRKDFLRSGVRGLGIGAALPSVMSTLGYGMKAFGAGNWGNAFANYGAKNAILPSLVNAGVIAPTTAATLGGTAAAPAVVPTAASTAVPAAAATAAIPAVGGPSTTTTLGLLGAGALVGGGLGGKPQQQPQQMEGTDNRTFFEKLSDNFGDYFSNPKDLLSLASAAGSFAGRKKPKSPEEIASKQKRMDKAMLLTAEELAAKEAALLAERQMERRIAKNQYLPEERFDITPLYRKSNSPDEYARTGKWLSYYDNPNYAGNPLLMKMGGKVPQLTVEEQVIEYPAEEGFLFRGDTNGQDDKIPARLSDGEYVIPADVVAHAGDGNTDAGAKRFDELLQNIRKRKGGKVGLPPKIKSNLSHYLGR